MWYHEESSKYRVQDRKFAIRTDAKDLYKNLEVIDALVQASVCVPEFVPILGFSVANTGLSLTGYNGQ